MKKLLAAMILLGLASPAFAQTLKQYNVTSALNQTKYFHGGALGGALTLINTAQDASTDCEGDALTDTDDLTCAHTGEIIVAGMSQMSVEVVHSNNSGTEVQIECDTWRGISQVWIPVYKTAGNSMSVRQWNTACSADCNIQFDFNVNADKLRCRGWVTSGAATDTLKFNLRIGSEGGS
jgi:hypothetical protein